MIKYSIEGNINFYEELYKSLDENSSIEDSEDVCLITNLPLTHNFVTLDCKHRFNYVPLINDLVTRKNKLSAMDIQTLKINEIRCPYCRNKEGKLLPYYEDMGVGKMHGVNYIDETKLKTPASNNALVYINAECSYKPTAASYGCSHTYVTLHDDGKYYCNWHKKMLEKQAIKEKFQEKINLLKQKKIEDKMKAKLEVVKLKEEAKQKEKEAKQKEKEAKKKEKGDNPKPLKKKKPDFSKDENLNNGENVVLFSTNGCKQILKTGLRKGEICGCKIELCKIHKSFQPQLHGEIPSV
jgi:hypothetical protein